MRIRTVQCCQCGSPLTPPEMADARFIQCEHCSASLEIRDLEHGSITRLRADLSEVQEATAEHASLLQQVRLEQDLVRLDREWRDHWKTRADTTEGQTTGGAALLTLILTVCAIGVLSAGWSARAPMTRAEVDQEAKAFAESFRPSHTYMHPFAVKKTQVKPIPRKAHIPARIGSILALIGIGCVIRFMWWDGKRFCAARQEYLSRRQHLQSQLSDSNRDNWPGSV